MTFDYSALKEWPEYDSPLTMAINQISCEMAKAIDDGVVNAVVKAGFDVDKEKLVQVMRQDADRYREAYRKGYETAAAQRYTANQVAEIITELLGDPCACNFNYIDDWLPALCDFAEDSLCPHPVGVACWEQWLKHRKEHNESQQT